MKSYIFRIIVDEDAFEDGRRGCHAYCPVLKGCHTWGHTPAEALANMREAVSLYLEDLIEAGEPIPIDPDKGVIEWDTPSVSFNVL